MVGTVLLGPFLADGGEKQKRNDTKENEDEEPPRKRTGCSMFSLAVRNAAPKLTRTSSPNLQMRDVRTAKVLHNTHYPALRITPR